MESGQVVGIVGAGPAGRTPADALDRAGIDFEVRERHYAIGGEALQMGGGERP